MSNPATSFRKAIQDHNLLTVEVKRKDERKKRNNPNWVLITGLGLGQSN